ncbi:MAG: gliding motility-associated C-terminal domain-containing protein [Saprospiraceae bacterium]|nr:gliding motility-associated C-terminal domain-containing protein [Saprospiraceae bacterium]
MRHVILLSICSFFLATLGINFFLSTPMFQEKKCKHASHSHGNHTHNHAPPIGGFCGFDSMQLNLSPQEIQLQNQLEQQLYSLLQKGYPTFGKALYTIPVVVHVVHNNGPGNIPNTQVTDAIQHLNDAFANIGVYNPATGVDVEVQFCLAQRDPAGNTTNGITNTVSPLTNMNMNTQDLALKNLIRWNPLDYVNIWVVNDIQGGVAGYAYFPSSHGNNNDGIVLESNFMGTNTNNSKVLVHEMGHYLGLYHTFEAGCTNNDCLVDGDKVCDTPPDNTTANIPCSAISNSCTTDEDDLSANNPFRPIVNGGLGDQNDQIENYMDYSALACYDRFTAGQKVRMHFFLTGTRASLLSSEGCQPPCTSPINIGFNASATTITTGTTVNFTNTTTNGVSFEWFNNATSFGTTTNNSQTFNTPGIFNIVLEASNGDPNCTVRDSVTITVNCAAQAAFTASSNVISTNDVVFFTDNSSGATSYEWYVNNILEGTGSSFNFSFTAIGNYDVFLVVSDGTCTDTSSTIIITVTSSGLAQTGLPVWPLAVNGNVLPQIVDWRDTIPAVNTIFATTTNGGQTGAAFNECGQLAFYVLHTGSGNQNNLFIYADDGTPLLTNGTANAPGLDAVKGAQEIQVIKVPLTSDEWYIIYKKWTTDVGAIGNNGGYTEANWLFSRVQYSGGNILNIIQRDIPLVDATGNTHTYTDGAAVSRTAGGVNNQHYLYLCRRTAGVNNVSLDRFLITNTGITFVSNTGNIPATTWSLSIAGSPIELSPTEDKIAVVCRNQSVNYTDLVLFDANLFNTASAQTISLGNLILQPDGTPIDQSNILNISGAVDVIALNNSFPLNFLRNMEKKVNNVEFSPNGRFLYFTAGGYVASGTSNVTYLGQIDLDQTPFEVRLQVQTVPSGLNMSTGGGCLTSNTTCLNSLNSVVGVESCFDGNLYFSKRASSTLFVIPDPNGFMPQNLVPSDIDLSSPTEPNININAGIPRILPDQIDGFNYLSNQFREVELIVQKLDCDNNCDSIPYILEITDSSGTVVESFQITQCPDTITFCADTGIVYSLRDTTGLVYPNAIFYGSTLCPNANCIFDFTDNSNCGQFICDGSFYQTIGDTLGSMILYEVFDNPVQFNLISNLSANGLFTGINAIAYNPVDNFIYGINSGMPHQLYKINSFGIVSHVGNITGLMGNNFVAGCMDGNGTYYITGNNQFLYSIDINTLVATQIGTSTIVSADIAYNPANGLLYGVDDIVNRLISINPITSAITPIGPPNPQYSMFGALYFNAQGSIIAYGDNVTIPSMGQESLVRINPITGAITQIGIGPNAGTNDGCSCPFGVELTKEAPLSVQAGSTFSYTFKIYNRTSFPITNVQFSDILTNGLVWTSEPQNLSGVTISGTSITGSNTAIFTIDSLQTGLDSFTIDVTVPCVFPDTIYSNSAMISGLSSTITIADTAFSDNPFTAAINDTTDIIITPYINTETLDLGPDTSLCENAVLLLNAGDGFNSYLWQNGHIDSSITVNETGLYWVEAITICGDTLRDSIIVSFDSIGLLTLIDTTICLGDTLNITLDNSVFYQWLPNQAISCNNCSTPSFFPSATTSYIAITNNALGCFSVDSFTLTVDSCFITSRIDTSICLGTFFSYAGSNIPPNTIDTITLTSNLGIDSFVIVTVTGLDTFNITIDTSACAGDSIFLNNQFLQAGTTTTFNLQTSSGCDSIITVNVASLDTFNITIDTAACNGDSIFFNNQFLQAGTTTTFNLLTSNGCDSIITVNVANLNSFNTIIDTATCAGDSIQFNAQFLQAGSSTTFNLITNDGCDSIITVNVASLDTFNITIDTAACNGDSIFFNNQFLQAGTTTTFNLLTSNGCDSIITVNVASLDTFNIIIDTATCAGDSIQFNSQFLQAGTSTTFNLLTNDGCDSIITVNVVSLDTFNITIDTSICAGDSIQFNSQFLQAGTSTTFNLLTNNGCDSIITVNVASFNSFNTIIDTATCAGDSVFFNAQFLQAGTSNTFNLLTNDGCDSIITVNVASLDTFNITIDTAICAGNNILFNGQILQSGTSTTFNLQTYNGCDSVITVNVASLDTFNISIDTIICNGDSILFNGQFLDAGTINTFNLQTISGCDSIVTVNVQSFPISFTSSSTNVSCNNGNDGTVTINVNGGLGGFNFIWNNGQTASTATGLTAGIYCVTVTDSIGCSIDTCITISEPAALSNISFSTQNVSCFNANDGQLTASLSGGIQPYDFLWSNGQTGSIATGLDANIHSVTITDDNGCTITDSAPVTQPIQLQLSFNIDSVLCNNGNSGQIEAIVSGNTTPPSFLWDVAANNQNTAIATGLSVGNYSVTASDLSGCTVSGNATVQEPTPLIANIINQSNPLCNSFCDGMIEVDALGATPNYSFIWTNGQTTSIATGVCSGSHNVTVTDANNCTISVGGVLTDPAPIVVNPQVLSNFNGSPISCPGAADGSVGVTASGGTGGLTYTWSPLGQNTAVISGLLEDTYCVSVTDAVGCTADTCITISDPVQLAATFTKVDVFCNGDTNGQILVTATPGTGTLGVNGYEYKITGPGQSGNVFSAVNNFSNLGAGTYTIVVRDGNNCEIQLTIDILEPPAVLIDSVVVVDALCFGAASGTATAHPSGGVGNFTYQWNSTAAGQTTQTATGLAFGVYSVTVIDSNGCHEVDVFNVGQATQLTGSISGGTIPCIGGIASATANGNGGTPIAITSYIYNWTNGQTSATAVNLAAGVHCVTITDANACTVVECVTITAPSTAVSASISAQTDALCLGSSDGTATAQGVGGTPGYTYVWQTIPNQNTQIATGLAAGSYTVVVTDTNGCTAQTTVTISEPSSAVAAVITGTNNTSCNGQADGDATVSGSGGTPGYTFLWSNGQTAAIATGLSVGVYAVTVTDNNGCTTSLTTNISEPLPVDITQILTTDVACKGDATGTASLSVNGGTPGFTYQWSGALGQTGTLATGLSAGSHTVTATDVNGCFDIDTFVISEPAQAMSGILTGQDALCFGSATGEIGAVVQGGTVAGNYSYVWNTVPVQTTVIADSIPAGTYTVIVTDDQGCTISLTGTIGEATQLLINASMQQAVTCFGGNDGIATASPATGGTPDYNYVWSDALGQTSLTATGLSAGVYTIVAQDTNSCTASSSVTITEDTEMTVNESIINVSCFGGNDGSIDIVSSNKNISNFVWDVGVGNPIIGLSAGTYSLTATDISGCQNSFSFTVTEPNELVINMVQSGIIACAGDSNAIAEINTTGGTPNYSYNWSSGQSTSTINNLAPGNYTVTVSDSKGCIKTESLDVTEPEPLMINGTTTATLCAGDSTGTIAAFGSGGTTNTGLLRYSLDGTNWQTGNLFTGLQAGIYTLTIEDNNGCTKDTLIVVQDADPFFITNMTPDTTMEYLDSLMVEAEVNDTAGVLFSWTQLEGTTPGLITDSSYNFIITPIEKVTYQFTAINPNGCELDSIVIIDVNMIRRANAPSAFTPNDDGVNDFFFIQGGEKVEEVTIFRIYDRWGNLLFEGNNLDINVDIQGWNGKFRGKKMNTGSFTWYAEVLFKDGHTEVIKGDVLLLR